MRKTDERMQCIRKRASDLREKEKRRSVLGFGSVSAVLFAILVNCISTAEHSLQSAVDVQLAGASMLSEDVGGYVLVAVIAFFAAALITYLCMKQKNSGASSKMPPAQDEMPNTPEEADPREDREQETAVS